MTDPALLETFERRFRVDPDPWNFAGSPYEAEKRMATVAACGPLDDARVLELGAANGILAAALAERAGQVTAIEAVPSAAAAARARLAAHPNAAVVEGLLPADVPPGPFDVVVASEILYYLDAETYASTLLRHLPRWVAPGGRLVAVHYRPEGPERPRSAAAVHADLARHPELRLRDVAHRDTYLLSVLERR